MKLFTIETVNEICFNYSKFQLPSTLNDFNNGWFINIFESFRSVKFTMAKALASSGMATPTRVISSTGFSMARASSAGPTALRTEASSEAMKSPASAVTNGQINPPMKDRSRMASDMVRASTSIRKKASSIKASGSME